MSTQGGSAAFGHVAVTIFLHALLLCTLKVRNYLYNHSKSEAQEREARVTMGLQPGDFPGSSMLGLSVELICFPAGSHMSGTICRAGMGPHLPWG